MILKCKHWPKMTSKLNKAEKYIRSNRVWSHTSTSSWDSSLVIYRLLWFTGLVLACLVKSPRSKSVASSSLTAVYGKTHTSQTWLYISRLAHTTGSRARGKSHIRRFSLNSRLSPSLSSSCLFSALLPHNGSKEMWLFKLMWQANAFILGLNELWTKFSMGAIWCMLCSVRMIPKILGSPIFGIKKLLYTTIPYLDSVKKTKTLLIFLFIRDTLLTKSGS